MKQEPSHLTTKQINEVIKSTSNYFGVSVNSITGNSRIPKYVLPRHIAMTICRQKHEIPLKEIGFGFNRDHTSVINAVGSINHQLRYDNEVRAAYAKLYDGGLINPIQEYEPPIYFEQRTEW